MDSIRRILVVDDNADAADLVVDLLQAYGFNVEVAYGGPDALSAARATPPTLMFLDIGMPFMDGYQVATAIRADETLRNIKLVALTAWGDEASRMRARAAGFDMHLTKPAELADLLAIAKADG